MPPRASLIDTLKRDQQSPPAVDPATEATFVHGTAVTPSQPTPQSPPPSAPAATPAPSSPPPPDSRPFAPQPTTALAPGLIPVNVRIRPDLARALKTASLTRQLHGTTPFCKREIVEQALESWLRAEGYLE